MSINVLFLAPTKIGSGNQSTAIRIIKNLNTFSKIRNIYLKNSLDYETFSGYLNEFCKSNNISIIFIIHAYHSGRLFFNENVDTLKIPIICIFGGTDLHSPFSFWLPVVIHTIKLSKYLVCFSNEMKYLIFGLINSECDKCIIIPQAVQISREKLTSKLNDYLNSLFLNKRKIITWAGCIRKIKDPMFIEPILKDVNEINNDILFIYIGYSLDNQLTESVRQIELNNSNFKYINGLSSEETHLFISKSWAFLNTSINEGMSLAILEAMKLGVPCLIRSNIGNCSIVKHAYNGLLFKNSNELLQNIKTLQTMSTYERNLIKFNAFLHINVNHSVLNEKNSYYKLIIDSICEQKIHKKTTSSFKTRTLHALLF